MLVSVRPSGPSVSQVRPASRSSRTSVPMSSNESTSGGRMSAKMPPRTTRAPASTEIEASIGGQRWSMSHRVGTHSTEASSRATAPEMKMTSTLAKARKPK